MCDVLAKYCIELFQKTYYNIIFYNGHHTIITRNRKKSICELDNVLHVFHLKRC